MYSAMVLVLSAFRQAQLSRPGSEESKCDQRASHNFLTTQIIAPFQVIEHVQPGKLEPVLPQAVIMYRVAVGDKPGYEKQELDRQYMDVFGMAGHEKSKCGQYKDSVHLCLRTPM